jgi:hypothetical protein
MKQFFHTISRDSTGQVHLASVKKEEGYYVHTVGSHMFFFETLREFVRWHYESENFTILDLDDYPFEQEIMVPYTRPLTHMELERQLIADASAGW